MYLVKEVLDKITNFKMCLAPMVGLSHVAMRESLRVYMPDEAKTIWPTEMLSSFKLPNQKLNEVSFSKKIEDEEGLVPQILGNEKEPIEKSIAILKEWGCIGVDINMGCPVKKALKHNYGVSLMGDPLYASKVTEFAVNSSDLPVSVKFRAGIQKDVNVLTDFSKGIEKAGASWVTLHPRTSAQKRRGKSDWQQIKYLKDVLSIPVIGNGDVQNLQDYFRMKEETDCDMVMIGRALTARPWLFWQLGEREGFNAPKFFNGLKAPQNGLEEGAEYGRHIKRFIKLCYLHFDERDAMKKVKYYIRISHVWLMFGHDLVRKTAVCKNEEAFLLVVEDFFSRPQKMMQTTSGAQ